MTAGPKIRLFAILIVAWMACVPAAWANLVVNGGFEDTTDHLSGWTPSVEYVNSSPFHTVDPAAGVLGGVTYFNPYEGAWSLDLEGSRPSGYTGSLSGSIEQTLTTTPGQTYALQFAMGGNYWWANECIKNNTCQANDTKSLEVLLNGKILGKFTYNLHTNDTITNFTWDLHELVIVGSGTDILEFRSVDPQVSGYGAFIDAISVTTVSEPATMLLLGLGLAGLAGVRRPRN